MALEAGAGCQRLGSYGAVNPQGPSVTTRENMQKLCRVLAVTGAVVLLLAIVAADEPVSHGKPEASGDSELTTPLERLTRGVTPVSLAGADRSHTDDVHPGGLNGDSASLDAFHGGSFNVDPLTGEIQSGPAAEVPAQSNESQESVDHDTDSEEALASQGM